MAIEKREQIAKDTPEVQVTGSSVEVFPEASRADQIRDAAEILVSEEGVLLGDEQLEEVSPAHAGMVRTALIGYEDSSKLAPHTRGWSDKEIRAIIQKQS